MSKRTRSDEPNNDNLNNDNNPVPSAINIKEELNPHTDSQNQSAMYCNPSTLTAAGQAASVAAASVPFATQFAAFYENHAGHSHTDHNQGMNYSNCEF